MEEKVFNSEFYSKLHSLRMSLAISIASGMNGGRKSNAKGNSVEFSDFREYRLGDDIRRIDWNAYGRFDKLFVKLFMEEKEGLFHVIVDASKSMNYGEKDKGVCALRVAGALSYIVLENADRLYLDILKDGTSYSRQSMTGIQSISKAYEYLENVKFEGEGELLKSMQSISFRRRGLVFFITDGFTDDLEEIIKYLRFKHQDVVLIHIHAREEIDPEFEGTVSLTDCETGHDMKMTMSNMLVKTYKKSYEDYMSYVKTLCKKQNVRYVPIVSDASMDSLIYGSLSKVATNN